VGAPVLPLLKYNVGAPLISWIILVDMVKAGERNCVLGFTRGLVGGLKNARR
jgi:hypothetical protein